jgi:hypothetical protein
MAASDKRELILELLARDKTEAGTKSAGKNIGDVGDKAEKSSRKLGLFGKSAQEADDKAEGLSKETNETKRSLERLDVQIKLAEHELRGLAKAFADTDDAAQKLDISKVQRKLQQDIARLTKNQNILKGIIPNEPQTKSFGDKVREQIRKGIGNLGDHKFLTGAGILGTALAPEIAGLMAAAVVGGVGIGGIVGGVALAAKNPAISGWAGRIGHTFMDGITKEAEGAFTKPLEGSLSQLEAAASGAVPKIGKIFDNLAPSLEPLTKDLITAGNALLDGFVYGSAKAKPVLDALGRLIVELGTDFEGLTKQFADHSDVAADAVDHVTDSIHLMMEGLGPLITVLAETYKWLDKVNGAASGIPILGDALHGFATFLGGPLAIVGDFVNNIDNMKASTKGATWVVPPLTEEQQKLKTAMDDSAKAARGEQDALDELSKQMKAQTDPVFALLDAQEKLKKQQKATNDAIKEHGKNSDEAKDAERRLAEAAIELEGAAGALGGTFNGKMTPAMESTRRAAGLTEGQIKALKKQFGEAKNAGNDFAKKYAAQAAVNGVPGAIRQVKSLKAELASMKTKWTVTIRQNFLTFGKPYSPGGVASGNIGGLATGGSTLNTGLMWVGENGPELYDTRQQRILSASSSRGRSVPSAPAAAGPPRAIRLELAGQQEVVTMLRYLIRTANLIQ